MDKKLFILLFFIFLFPVASATLKIEKEAIIDTVIPEISQPAKYSLEITNLDEGDVFEIYSLVGININPNKTFFIASGKTEKIEIELWPEQAILEKLGTFNFIYKIKGVKSGIQEDVLSIKLIDLKDAFDANSYNIDFDSEEAKVYIKNKIALDFPEIEARFYSAFFDFDRKFSLNKNEKKEFETSLNREKTKKLEAGEYALIGEIKTFGVTKKIQNSFKFTEKANISASEAKKGGIISTHIIEKTNEGNLPFVVQTRMDKNIISRLFTTFNVEPVSVEREGFSVSYVFQKEIKPAEVFLVKAVTNWLYPLILLVALIIIVLLIEIYTSTFLMLRKKVTFVKTKGGEFALKITLTAKAKKFVEKIRIIDKIPALAKLHERFGAIEPDLIDEKNKRLEWNIDSMQEREERIFSYIIYSKIAPMGKFELPSATATYEREGKIHEAESNRVFFLSEPRKK